MMYDGDIPQRALCTQYLRILVPTSLQGMVVLVGFHHIPSVNIKESITKKLRPHKFVWYEHAGSQLALRKFNLELMTS